MNNSITTWISGQTRVRGTYCDVPFTGVIVDGRPTPDGKNTIFGISVDAPIFVYGQMRTKVECWTNSPCTYVETL